MGGACGTYERVWWGIVKERDHSDMEGKFQDGSYKEIACVDTAVTNLAQNREKGLFEKRSVISDSIKCGHSLNASEEDPLPSS